MAIELDFRKLAKSTPLEDEKSVSNGKRFNTGNATASAMHMVMREAPGTDKNRSDVVQGTVYGFEIRENRFADQNPNMDEGTKSLKFLYFAVEYNQKKGIMIKCNDDETIDRIIKKPKDEYTIKFVSVKNIIDGVERIYPEMVSLD